MSDPTIWQDEWESQGEQPWEGGTRARRLTAGKSLGASLYEIPPHAKGGAYHFHHGNEELLIVLRGRPTLRTPQGERELAEGEVIHFGLGADSAHALRNDTDQPVRYIMTSTIVSPDAVEYPDTKQLSVMAFTTSQTGKELWDMRTLDP